MHLIIFVGFVRPCRETYDQGYPFKILDGGGLVPPHWGGTHGGGHDPDGGGLTRDSRDF